MSAALVARTWRISITPARFGPDDITYLILHKKNGGGFRLSITCSLVILYLVYSAWYLLHVRRVSTNI